MLRCAEWCFPPTFAGTSGAGKHLTGIRQCLQKMKYCSRTLFSANKDSGPKKTVLPAALPTLSSYCPKHIGRPLIVRGRPSAIFYTTLKRTSQPFIL